MKNIMQNYEGSTVLITGASSGIGKEFAINLAAKGANLIITARSEAELIKLAQTLKSQYPNIWIKVITGDLSKAGEAMKLYSSIVEMGLSVDYLINNAGFGKWSEFLYEKMDTYNDMLMLNINSLMELCYLCLPNMIKKNNGGIINVASTAAFQSMPYQAVYGASKAFVLNFSESLSGELLNTNIHVMALCPGATESNFMANANADTTGMVSASANSVVKSALKAYGKGGIYFVPGKMNYINSLVSRFVTRLMTVKIVVGMFKNKVTRK
jgi:short-subunit dehydrogenase